MSGARGARPAVVRRRLAGRLPRGRRAGSGRDRPRAAGGGRGAERPRRLGRRGAPRRGPPAQRGGTPLRGRGRGDRSRLRGGHAARRARPRDGPRRRPSPGSWSASRSSIAPAGSGPTSPPSPRLFGRLEGDLLDQVVPPGAGLGEGVARPGEPLDHDPPVRAAARLHGPARPRPVRPRPPLRGGRAGPAPLRGGERSPDRPGARRAARSVPHLDRPPRDDPRLRVRGPPLAPALPRRPPRAPARAGSPAAPRTSAGTRRGPWAARSGAGTGTGWSASCRTSSGASSGRPRP